MNELSSITHPVLPLRDIVVFPHMIVRLFVGRERSVRALEEVMKEDKQILLASQIDAGEDEPSVETIYKTGVLANVLQILKLPDGAVKILVEGMQRVEIKEFVDNDDFFQANDEMFDIVFIDGLHTYDQVKKDILNSVDCLKENGIILVHDCMPDSLSKQAVPRYRMIWNGDVWKAITDLRQKEDLEIFTCEMDQGIGVIKKNKNSSILNLDKPINNLKFKDYYTNYKEYLRVISLEEFKKIF